MNQSNTLRLSVLASALLMSMGATAAEKVTQDTQVATTNIEQIT